MIQQFHSWVYTKKKKKSKTLIRKNTHTPIFIAALFTITKTWKQLCPSTNKWLKKMWHICTKEHHSVMKRNKMWPFAATWIDLEGTVLSETSQTEKDKYCIISLICGIWKYNKLVNITKKEADSITENKLLITTGDRGGQRNNIGARD